MTLLLQAPEVKVLTLFTTCGWSSTQLRFNDNMAHITSCAFGNRQFSEFISTVCQCLAYSSLMPMLTGNRRAHHGDILKIATRLVEEGKLRPIVDPRHFTLDQAIEAHDAVQDRSANNIRS